MEGERERPQTTLLVLNLLPSFIRTTANAMECGPKIKSNDTFSFRIPGTDIKKNHYNNDNFKKEKETKEKAWGS